jgi:HAE1 family hydrophobic/amphiphilic exporter-1
MGFSSLFINRPVMTTLVMAGILIFGVAAFRLLPMSDLPNVDFPTIQVSASLPGASPETMAAAVATTLERQFSTIAGIDSMLSSSALGSTQITIQFSLSRDIDGAAQDVQAAIARCMRSLPQDMPSPPTYYKVNPADQPILFVALTSPTLPLSSLDEYAETLMAQRISTVSGVAQVQVYGSQKYAVRVRLNPVAMSSKAIGIDDVVRAIDNGNVNLPTGVLYGPHRAFTVRASGQLDNAQKYRPIIVAYRNGSSVRLGEIANVIDSVENDKVAAWYVTQNSLQRSIVLAIQRQPGTNTVEVADAVKKLLPTFREQLPASVSIHILLDRSTSIRDSVRDVEFTLLLTLVLVVLVIFLFLRNASATLIPSLALPMAIVGTFVVMYLCHYSLDNLSLMALTLSVGFVVDDAIVMLENIVRHMEMGKAPLKAAIDGAKEIGFTILSMTLSLAAVFIPVLFMGGLIGRLFREFAVTIGVAVLVSGFIALTLTPMLSSRFLLAPGEIRHGRDYAFSEKIYALVLGFYERTLKWVLLNKRSSMLFSVATLLGTIALFVVIPKGFLPSEDRSQISGSTEAAEGVSYKSMFEYQQAVSTILQKRPEIDSFMSSAGSRGSSGGNSGS